MKVRPKFIRASILGEIMRACSMDTIADAIVEALNEKKDVDVSVSDTHTDGIVIRKKKDCDLTDLLIRKQAAKALRGLVSKNPVIVERMLDEYDITYTKSSLSDDALEGILIISRNGRLITLEFDV